MADKNNRRRKKPGMLRKIFPYFAIILVASVLIVAIIWLTSRNGRHDRQDMPSLMDITTQDNRNNLVHNVETDSNPEIKELVQRYFNAVKAADVTALSQIVEQETPFSEEKLKKEVESIDSYHNIVCYTVAGLTEKTYIVYVYYEIKFIGIDTNSPALITLYIAENENGQLYIDKRPKSGEVSAYIQEVAGWQEIRQLVTQVNTRLQEACASDQKLRDFKDFLDGKEVTKPTEPTTASSQEQSEEEESSSQAAAQS